MKTKKSQQKLALKIHKIKAIIKHLENLKNNPEAEVISQLLKMMSSLFEEVDQRLTELEK
jgi:ribosome-binding protein aMBF1 (putative translation factor)